MTIATCDALAAAATDAAEQRLGVVGVRWWPNHELGV